MKKTAIITLSALSALLVLGCTIAVSTKSSNTNKGYIDSQVITSENTTADSEYVYIMKIYNGKISIFRKGESQPFRTLDTDISELPDGDIQLLSDGIKIKSDAQLQKSIEDYSS